MPDMPEEIFAQLETKCGIPFYWSDIYDVRGTKYIRYDLHLKEIINIGRKTP